MTTIIYVTGLFKSQIIKNLRLRNLTQECLKPTPKAVKRRIKPSKDVEDYIKSKNYLKTLKDDIPIRFLKRNRKAPDDLYLIDSYVAKDVAEAIKPYIINRNKTVIETNPGFGFITKELLEAGLKEAQLYEATVYFRNSILDLVQKYPRKLKVYNRDFFSIWKLSYQDRHDNGDRVKTMLSNVKVKHWEQDPAMTIIGTTASSNFIRHLLLSLIFQFGIMTYGRCEMFLTMPPYLYLQLMADKELGYVLYRASSVLFQIFCDCKLLLKVPRKSYLPWDNMIEIKKNSKLWKYYNVDPDYMYLVRIEFKRDLPVPTEKLQHLWYFVQRMMLSRTSRIIPSLEKWIPGCGINLILANSSRFIEQNTNFVYPDIDIFTQTGELNAQQFLNLFRDFSSSPEYSESPFIASMEAALLKMESMQDMDHQNQEIVEHEEGKDPDTATQSKNIVDET